MSVPFVGFKFVPTDEELVGEFLFKKLTGTLCPNGSILIPGCDLYSKEEPWQVFQRFHPNPSDGHNECLYFFTQLKKKTIHSRAARKVGDGTWHGEDAGKKIVVDVELDGEKVSLKALKKRFSYRNKKSDQNCCWTMNELSILEYNGEPEIVLCQLKKNESAAVNKDYTCDDERPVKKRKSETKRRKLETENMNNHADLSNRELSNEFSEESIVDFIEQTMDASVDEEGINGKTKSEFGNDSDTVGEIMEHGDELNFGLNENSDVMVRRDESNINGKTKYGFKNDSDIVGEIMEHGDELNLEVNQNSDVTVRRDESNINEKTKYGFENDPDIVGGIMEHGDELNLGVDENSDVTVHRDESNSELNNAFASNGESMVIGDEMEWDFNSNGDTNTHKGSEELREEDLDDFIKSLWNPEYLVTSNSDTQQDLLFPQSIFAEISHID
ncbi:NAC domain containing protein 41 [Euphorbia peplus]|nr:NAC domain containing protein 41 [Euphorbia peplus]